MTNMIEEAEKNVVRIAKELSDFLVILGSIASYGNKALKPYDKDDFFEGLNKMRSNVYRRYVEQINDCFILSGVGGEECKKYSFEKFKEHFGNDRYSIMQFLDKYGYVPNSYKVEDEKEFRKQGKDVLLK